MRTCQIPNAASRPYGSCPTSKLEGRPVRSKPRAGLTADEECRGATLYVGAKLRAVVDVGENQRAGASYSLESGRRLGRRIGTETGSRFSSRRRAAGGS
jgi:hypothetical protein